jgi:hypothetical protein
LRRAGVCGSARAQIVCVKAGVMFLKGVHARACPSAAPCADRVRGRW